VTTVVWIGSPKFTTGHPAPLLALVAHRMVGTLPGTDVAFTTGTRQASTTFGIGHKAGRLEVHQYVRLGDQAWGNGNWDVSGSWDDRYPTTLINSRTVAIEHEDNGGLPVGDPRRGVVTEDILAASVNLMAALLRGDLAELQGLGIRFRAGTEAAICRELRAIVPGPHTIIDHHYISGRLKPYCWRPWAADKVGFPQARYLTALAPSEDAVFGPFTTPEVPTRAYLKEDASRPGHSVWIYTTDALTPDGKQISLDPKPFRPLRLVGWTPGSVVIVAYETAAADVNTVSTSYYVAASGVAKTEPIPPDCSAVQHQLDLANGRILAAVTQLGGTI
jgi:hypothetical protein